MEEAVLLTAALMLYAHLHFSWIWFGVLFLVPDLFMLGYIANPRIGSFLYNSAHTLFLPLILFFFGYSSQRPAAICSAIIWVAHIAFDRLLGYGLKYPTKFKDTHLQHIA